MEGQGSKQKGKAKTKPELGALASGSSTGSSSAPSSASAVPTAYLGDLSCAMIEVEESSTDTFAGLLSTDGHYANILDSGTSSHLFKDRNVFWTYEATQARSMRTANHGVLQTSASGDCLVRFTLRGVTTMVKLRDCLHAPSACLNLLSVGRMTSAGSKVGCTMDDGKFAITAKNADGSRKNIYKGNQSNNLYFVDLEFVYPPEKRPTESAMFTKVIETMDLWHHRMGHIGEDATRSLLQSVKGVTFPPGDELSKCEPCIIGKHTRSPHPSSTTPRSTKLLELVFCDLCGPFPVLTPHGKLYLIAFLKDLANVLKLHCLARKDQSAEVFHITRANWERKTGKKLLCFRVDGAGELGTDEFVKALENMGIERDVVPRYEHWKNGKMERVFRTIQGRMLAMLTAAQLPLTYWGEAALTAGFLFNLSVSSTLPKDTTPFELLKNTKPDVSHLRVWGVRRGYRVRSLSTNHFFDSGNVIFDGNIPYHALHEVSSTPKDYSSLPFPATVLDTVTPTVPTSPDDVGDVSPTGPSSNNTPPLPPTQPSSASSPPVLRTQRKLTATGHDYAKTIAAAKAHLQKLRSNAEQRRQLKETQEHAALAAVEEEDVPLCCEGGLRDFPDSLGETDDFAAAVASLDVDDYLQRDADGIFETTLLSLRSDVARDPRSPGYDVMTPPANHREAMMRHDAEEWKKVEDKELGMLKAWVFMWMKTCWREGRRYVIAGSSSSSWTSTEDRPSTRRG